MSGDQFLPSSEGTWARLSEVIVKGAQYNSRERQPHPKCLEGTRVDLLNYIHKLLEDREKNQLIWLHGTAGVGKSAVAFTVAERMRGLKMTEQTNVEKRLGATFFFSRKNTKRCTAGYFFVTLVYQLVNNFPSIRKDVNRAIHENPALLDPDTPLCDQMEVLFIQPLRKLRLRLRGCPPLVFVVDALDECTSEPELTDLILSLAQALREPDLPATHILLTSRSESHICKAFQNQEVGPLVCEIPVKTSGEGAATTISLDGADVDNDIYIFLKHSFGELANRHPDFPQPSRDQLAQLASRAGRRFIVASTMMKFIIDDGDNDPHGRLQLMLELTSELLPGTEVYKLYDSILSTCSDPKRAYLHLSVVAALADPLPMSQISKLLGPGPGRDVETTLVQLRSVIDIPTDSSLPVNLCHSSIRDYVSDPSNCSLLHAHDMSTTHSLLADASFRLMMKEIPKSTALLHALSELQRQSQALQPQDPKELKDSLVFLVQPPEPMSALLSLMWLRGDRTPDLRFWLETLDGCAWLQTRGGDDWLQTQGGRDWLQTQGGRDWLQTLGGKDWLQTLRRRYWLRTQGGRDWLQTHGGEDSLQTPGGQAWLQTKVGRVWLQTPVGREWLETRGGRVWLETQGGRGWLVTQGGSDWLETQDGRVWLENPTARDWLGTQGGRGWLRTHGGQDWLVSQGGSDWLKTRGASRWLETQDGRVWLENPTAAHWWQTQVERYWPQLMCRQDLLLTMCGSDWLPTTHRDWLQTTQRKFWLQTREGHDWLQTQRGHDWLQTLGGQDWLQSQGAQHWLQTQKGQDWLQTDGGHEWLQTQRREPDYLQTPSEKVCPGTLGRRDYPQTPNQPHLLDRQDWVQTPPQTNCLQTQRRYDGLGPQGGERWPKTWSGKRWLRGQDWLETPGGRDWLAQGGWVWLETRDGRVWLETPGGRDWLENSGMIVWLQTQDGKDWLWNPEGKDWLQTTRVHDWMLTQRGLDWLRTRGGREWLQTQRGRDWLLIPHGQHWLQTEGRGDWLQTEGGRDWLQTEGGGIWLQTTHGYDWLQTPHGRSWLQTPRGRDWLQTLHGKAWQSTPAASVWVTMEEFSSTLEAITKYKIAQELLLLPAFQVVQQFKNLPDFLMLPTFLALSHHEYATCVLPEGLFPQEIVRVMGAFIIFANEAQEHSRSASDALKYACQNWAVHLSRAPNPRDDKLNHIFEAFWNHHLLSWLERQWCLKGLRSCLVVLSQGQKLAKVNTVGSNIPQFSAGSAYY